MKKLALAAMIGLVSASAFAAQGDILARFRVINVNPDASWSNSGTVAGLNVDAKDAWAPEVDFTYMITNNIGAELILGTTRHEITTNLGSVGKVSVLPPTLTLQYHFMPDATFRPYVGAGINYTRFYNDGLKVGGVTNLSVKKNSWGPALQLGADYAINKNWFVNLDVKKIWIKTDVTADQLGGAKLGELKIDPWVFGIGFGTKF
ncbi:outer membrane protein [Chromobacterium alkanivorans]|uniref:OmpW/AlkL family protein n=1 Tax=Chromobacterium alkanivorans TaxID=1071719 RepID=UPI00216801BD|nr:OmpW family protein [Chromobacterium alkanivorans]MCS3805234.1 outer membrane protein [Chromobacterium alkanivorans]MCS3819573.1 outer membrane protein [Chromobacterium alkanivorans]MCS3874452.1 outer membrane protein [Chromobacterium alkanivorans]